MPESALPHFLIGLGTVGLILVALTSIFWLWMLIDCLTSPKLDGTSKILWFLVVFFLHFVGAVIYFFVGRAGAGRALPPA